MRVNKIKILSLHFKIEFRFHRRSMFASFAFKDYFSVHPMITSEFTPRLTFNSPQDSHMILELTLAPFQDYPTVNFELQACFKALAGIDNNLRRFHEIQAIT